MSEGGGVLFLLDETLSTFLAERILILQIAELFILCVKELAQITILAVLKHKAQKARVLRIYPVYKHYLGMSGVGT